MEMDVVVDEEAEEFGGAIVTAAGGAVEFELAVSSETPGSHPAFGGVAFDDDELLDMEGHVAERMKFEG